MGVRRHREEVRAAVLSAVRESLPLRAVAEECGISPPTVYAWRKREPSKRELGDRRMRQEIRRFRDGRVWALRACMRCWFVLAVVRAGTAWLD